MTWLCTAGWEMTGAAELNSANLVDHNDMTSEYEPRCRRPIITSNDDAVQTEARAHLTQRTVLTPFCQFALNATHSQPNTNRRMSRI